MAMGTGTSGANSRRSNRRSKRRAALSEINVTPMVDVMLVLLIIFMISAPLLTAGVKVQLPKTEAAALKDEGEPLTVTIDDKGQIFIMDAPASYAQLTPRLLAMTNDDTSKPIYVRGAATASWDTVAKVMGKLQSAGFTKINLLTDTMAKTPNSAPDAGAASSSAAAP
ncbi:MAG: ExbD/TolR family protein [Asticcacaulis sp.]